MLLFMALLTDCDELTLTRLRIIYREREVWSVTQVLDMMYQYPAPVSAVLLAQLAFVVIHPSHFCGEILPRARHVEVYLFSGFK